MAQDKKAPTGEAAKEIGEALSGMVHDCTNLLQSILLRAEFIDATEALSEENHNRIEQLVDETKLIADFLRSLLDHGRNVIEEEGARADIVAAVKRALANPDLPPVKFNLEAASAYCLGDEELLEELTVLLVRALRRGSDKSKSPTLSLSTLTAKEAGQLAIPWIESCDWTTLTIKREGRGDDLPFEEEFHVSHSELDAPLLDTLRIRGIVKLHKGVIKTEELVSDEGISLEVKIHLPNLTD